MRQHLFACAFALAGLATTAPIASADELVEEYNAYIGQDDLYNSNGEALSEPWQVIRQDRANYHRYRIRQDGDEGDRFFRSQANRAAAERMIRDGSISRQARRQLMEGDVMINVQIWEGPDGDYIRVRVD